MIRFLAEAKYLDWVSPDKSAYRQSRIESPSPYSHISINTSARAYGDGTSRSSGTCVKPVDSYR